MTSLAVKQCQERPEVQTSRRSLPVGLHTCHTASGLPRNKSQAFTRLNVNYTLNPIYDVTPSHKGLKRYVPMDI
jgi:hypothetical protein